MEVKVDSKLIKSGREDRGWTQDQLASVAGLSLRTIQRIENTGSASLESVAALAAVLSVQVADLRVNDSVPRIRAIRLSLELPVRLALAAVSGVLCGIPVHSLDYGFPYYATFGALFGVAVLCPYLRPGPTLMWRVLALIGASALSYFCAVMIALTGEEWLPVASALLAFVLASVVGTGIVLGAVKLLIPLRVRSAYWFLGLVASLLGGLAVYVGFEKLGDGIWVRMASYGAWHVLACLAIYRGRQSSDAEAGLLATFARVRGRFSIVPGWMKLSLPTPG